MKFVNNQNFVEIMQLAIRSYIDDSGKLVIPIKLRRQLNLKPRDKVSIACSGNKLTVTSFQSNIEEARNNPA